MESLNLEEVVVVAILELDFDSLEASLLSFFRCDEFSHSFQDYRGEPIVRQPPSFLPGLGGGASRDKSHKVRSRSLHCATRRAMLGESCPAHYATKATGALP